MNTAFILLGLLAAWWLLLTVCLTRHHRKQVRRARRRLSPEVMEECRQMEAALPRIQTRPIDFVIIIPIAFLLLPLYLYGRFVTDPMTSNMRDDRLVT